MFIKFWTFKKISGKHVCNVQRLQSTTDGLQSAIGLKYDNTGLRGQKILKLAYKVQWDYKMGQVWIINCSGLQSAMDYKVIQYRVNLKPFLLEKRNVKIN